MSKRKLNEDCRDYREQLSARFDGEPEGIDAEALGRHLASCAPCREFESDLRADWALLGSFADPTRHPDEASAASELLSSIRTRVAGEETPAKVAASAGAAVIIETNALRRHPVLWAGTLGSVAAVIVAAVVLFVQQPTVGEPEFLDHLPALVDLRAQAEGLEPELFALLLEELAPAETKPEQGAREGISKDDRARAEEELILDFLLEEELEGTRL